MLKYFRHVNISIILLLLFSCVVFSQGFNTYFHQDDFIHLSYSDSWKKVLHSFNLFSKGDFPFYRPIPTQVYFYFGKFFFGFNPLGYHIFNFLLYSLNVLLVYKLAYILSHKKNVGLISALLFSINATHIAPLFTPSYVHELFYVFFGLLSVLYFVKWIDKRNLLHFIFVIFLLILALMSKETAVILPGIYTLILVYKKEFRIGKRELIMLLPFAFTLFFYLVGHFKFYGIASSSSYQMIIGKPTINILGWYLLWALSTPNILIDFVGPGFKINPVFFQISQANGYIFFFLFPFFLIGWLILSVNLFIHRNRVDQSILFKLWSFGISWFVVGIIPLIIFPLHKLATEQAFSLFGLSFSSAVLIESIKRDLTLRIYKSVLIVIFVLLGINSIHLAQRTHWIIRSAYQAESVAKYLQSRNLNKRNDLVIYFRNGEVKLPQYGSSRQLYYALGNGIGLSLIFRNRNLNVYFEDIKPPTLSEVEGKDVMEIDSSLFLGY